MAKDGFAETSNWLLVVVRRTRYLRTTIDGSSVSLWYNLARLSLIQDPEISMRG